jgi:L,D-peptidoglycan transpeptidase YkuD (ErfK/YbiS/YcfS/YnhG family)
MCRLTLSVCATAWLGLLAATAGCSSGPPAQSPATGGLSPLRDSRQVVLVVSDDWDATSAQLQCYARDGLARPWRPVGDRIPVSLGRTGLAWGRGLHGNSPLPGPDKREGDGKAPAGVFDLPLVFGYAAKEEAGGVKLPYLALTPQVVGVDDVKSRHYNRIVRTDETAKDWDSAEAMRRDDGLYEWGVLVNHNASPVLPGAGSCIFLHVWRGEGKPTAGCTAMSRPHMVALATWLDPQAKPVLVQLPRAAYQRLASPWGLPAWTNVAASSL